MKNIKYLFQDDYARAMTDDTRRKGDAWMLHRLLADLGVENFQDEQESVVTTYLNYLNCQNN